MLFVIKFSKSYMMSRRSSKTVFLLMLVVQLLLFIPNTIQKAAALIPQDVDALVALHTAWLGNPSSWDLSTDPCGEGGHQRWLGIRCDINHTRVVRMLLINQDLAGSISPAIGNLTQLIHLDLSSNGHLGGALPVEIVKLANVRRFFVQNCNLSGTIPLEIGNMTSLTYFGLTENRWITGVLPPSIGLLDHIKYLDVSKNILTGTLPDSSTSGIGSGLDNLTKAVHFHLQDNKFSGSIPASIFNTEMQLLHLLLDDNQLIGNVPPTISNLLHAEIIRLDNNHLNGTIPSTFSEITNLTTLQLDNNQFSGQMPDLSNNTQLQILTVSNNPFQASTIPSWITNLKNLYQLSMDSTNLIGTIPIEIFGFSKNLSILSLASNQLNGTLNLTTANAALVSVNLRDNNITNVDEGGYKHALILDGNPYSCASGPIRCTQPSEAPAPSPSIPPEAPGCGIDCPYQINPNLAASCQCARPLVTYCEFYALKIPYLTNLEEPEMEELIMIGLNNNSDFLEGITLQATQIMVQIASSTVVRVFIWPPHDEEQWSSDEACTIAYALQNQDIQFSSIGPMYCEFRDKPYITDIIAGFKLSKGAKIGIGFGVAVFIISIFVIGVYAMKQKKRAMTAEIISKPFAAWIKSGRNDAMEIPKLKGAQWFSLEELRKCTNNFSDSNYIGKGGYGKVYIGLLESGERVAIKRASPESHQGVAEFKNEIELLSRVHHINLVALIGFCYEDGEQMLVYEYMPNGTLREFLTGQTGLETDWNKRIELALDSARGIAYLHTEAQPPIIHRDIKSTNILLDKKLVAKISDFGLCKLAIYEDGVAPVSAQVRGTLGYLDPDYYLTSRLTDRSDVYSFGVVLLEIITGKLPIEGGKYIVREVTIACQKSSMDVVAQSLVDPNLVEMYPPKDLEQLLGIALKCVDDNPPSRPSMVEVVKELEALVPIGLPKVSKDMEMEKLRSAFYSKPLPKELQESCSTSSFDTSEIYAQYARPLEPQ